MNEKLQELYAYIKGQGATDLSLEEFNAAYSNDPYKAKDVFNFVKGEGMEDTFLDVANYGIIGLLVGRDKWKK